MVKLLKRRCDKCGKYYEGQGEKYCSYTCAGLPHLENRKMPKETKIQTIERFMENVNQKENSCWEWTAGLRNGYGNFSYKGKDKYAHRISYMLFKNEAPDNKYVCHHCDNPKCVNPDHLFLGTQKDNMRDSNIKKRDKWSAETRRKVMPDGTYHNQKFKPDEIRYIRSEYQKDGVTLKKLANEFNTDKKAISRIVNYKTYKYIK
jgi:hypothetical protein